MRKYINSDILNDLDLLYASVYISTNDSYGPAFVMNN